METRQVPGMHMEDRVLRSKRLASGGWLKFSGQDLQYGPGVVPVKSCRIWPNLTENWEKSFACIFSCPSPLPSFYFLLAAVAFSQRKDSLQGRLFFFFHGEK